MYLEIKNTDDDKFEEILHDSLFSKKVLNRWIEKNSRLFEINIVSDSDFNKLNDILKECKNENTSFYFKIIGLPDINTSKG